MNVYIQVALVVCVFVCSLTAAPLQTGIKYRSDIADNAEAASSREKVLLLQRKLADLQRNLKRLEDGGHRDGRVGEEFEEVDDIAEALEQAVGIKLGKFDEVEDDETVDDVPADNTGEAGELLAEEFMAPEDEDRGELTSDEKVLLQMLKDKESTRTNNDVLRQFLEERVVHRDDNVDEEFQPKREEQQLTEEITGLNGEMSQDEATEKEVVDVGNRPVADPGMDGYFINRAFGNSELGPIEVPGGAGVPLREDDDNQEDDEEDTIDEDQSVRLAVIEGKLISDLKFALDHGITLDELLDDISDKEKVALQREALALGQQLADTEKELNRLG
ncbi:uncharacterized protein LOC144447294 [Glandiceps talaboti]